MGASLDSKPYVGGQAVIEGVMMRSPRCLAVAVRRADGQIVVREDAWMSIFERWRFLRWPFFRGSVILLESVYNGVQALNFAALHAIQGGEEPLTSEVSNIPPAGPAPKERAALAGTIALSFALALGLFVGVPHLLAWGATRLVGSRMGVQSFAFHALDGLFKIAIFVSYILGIAMLPEIRRVFEYHGAEHKAINTYEGGQDLTVDNARRWTTFHPRCGTSFVLFVLLLSIFVFASIFPFIPRIADNELLNHLAMIAFKCPLMIPLAGLAYELNRYASRRPDRAWVQAMVVPGRIMQRLTTREPSDDQLEIALAAMRAALRQENALSTVAASELARISKAQPLGGQVTVFRDFDALEAAMPAVP